MEIEMGSQVFRDVTVPLLWGRRAVIQDRKGRLSVIDLSGGKARAEIVGDAAAPGVRFTPKFDGFSILLESGGEYSYFPKEKRLSSSDLGLPDCQVTVDSIRVGGNIFHNNVISGFGVGIHVDRSGISVGGPLPAALAELVV